MFQTGAWILPDERALSSEVEAFLDAGEPPVYFGFSSMPAPQALSPVIVQTARALGRRAIMSRGWANLSLGDDERDAWPSTRSICRRCSSGSLPSSTMAVPARPP